MLLKINKWKGEHMGKIRFVLLWIKVLILLMGTNIVHKYLIMTQMTIVDKILKIEKIST